MKEKGEVFELLSIPKVHVIDVDMFTVAQLLSFLGRRSFYGADRIEGVVIKNYDKQLFGKIVDPLFEDSLDSTVHWSRKPLVINKLDI